MLTKKHIIKYKSRLLRKSWLLLLGFIFLFGVANAGSIDVHKVKGNTEKKTLPVEYALLGTDYAVTDFVTYANSASEVPPVIRKYSSYFGIVYTMGRIGGSLYSSAKLATAEEAAFAESAAKASTSEITTEETATATTVTSTEEKVTATSTEETAPTTPAKETTASEGTTTGTTTKENVPVETKTTEINDGSVAGEAEELSTVFINGWTKEKILALPKASRPNPNTYLKQSYIDNHLSQFDNGGSYLVPKESLDKYGRSLIGRPDGQFIMSKTEMDNLLNKAKGDLTIVESELGIPPGLWKNKELVRIDIPNPKLLHSRIPFGSEGGANELWIPGGKLPNGYSEAVIDQIPNGSYVETLTNIK